MESIKVDTVELNGSNEMVDADAIQQNEVIEFVDRRTIEVMDKSWNNILNSRRIKNIDIY